MATPKQVRTRGRLSLVLAAIVATVLCAAVAYASDADMSVADDVAPNGSVVTTFPAAADTRVHEALPTTNFGARAVLRVDGAPDPDIESYLRFTVSGLAGSVQRATLRLHALAATADGPSVAGTSNGWSERGMTWADRPAPTTAAVDDEGAIAIDSWAELDVTSLVSTNGTFSFLLTATHQDGVDFDSRESITPTLRPELIIETLTTNAPVNTSPPTISGTPQEGEMLTAASGSWNGSQPMQFGYQWRRCDASGANCADVAQATSQSYGLTQDDLGTSLRVVVTATNDEGAANASSNPSGVVIGAGDIVIAAAGDIASCAWNGDEATAQLLDSIAPTRVLTLGDHVYPNGTDAEFADCYEPTWGRHKAKTSPAPGNHDYNTPGATGYYNYFGTAAGDPTKGYYAFDLGAWRFYALNSNCAAVPCGAGSAQEQWLRADLAAHPQSCLAAYMHHPRFSSSSLHGSSPAVSSLWNALYDYRADLVLAGHDHVYERFTRLDPTGAVDLARGIRSFVVGTGGASSYSFGTPVTGSEARGASDGVLKLILREGGYDWTFVPVVGSSFTDSGSDTCGSAPSDTTPPSAPTSLVSTTAQAGNVALGWGESSDAVGPIAYDVYRNTQVIGSTTTTSFTDTSAIGGSTYQYYVTARDAAGNDSAPSNTASVDVAAANQVPVITSEGGGPTVALSRSENQTGVTDVDATDADGTTPTYAISGGADAAGFAIDPNSGVLTFAVAPDYESPVDANMDNVYEVTVAASDGSLADTQAISVTVTDVAEAANTSPTIVSDGGGATAAKSVLENQTEVTDVGATDPDPDTLSYAVTAGADMAAFTIDPATGVLAFLTSPNFELPTDVDANNVYEVVVMVSDGNGGSDTQAIAVTVVNANEFPPVITSDGGGASAAHATPENQTAVTDVGASDGDGTAPTYAIAGGADAARFTIVPATGVVTFVTAPNFEAPTDSGTNNVYDVVVSASDGSNADTQAIAVTVTNVVESGGSSLYFSLLDAGRVGAVSADNEDIVFFDGTGFALSFDGSDVGLAGLRIDAFSWIDATSLLLSFDTPGSFPGIAGTVDDSDLVRFDATSLGDVTAGSFSLYLDGSDVGLTTSGEDVDAVELLPGGHLLVSTISTVATTGAAGEDEDLLEFVPNTLGPVTSGSFSLYFDGSDVLLTASGEDVDGAARDASGKLYLSTLSNFAVSGISGADEDVCVFTPTSLGNATAGTYSPTLYFDGSAFGLAANDVFAIDVP